MILKNLTCQNGICLLITCLNTLKPEGEQHQESAMGYQDSRVSNSKVVLMHLLYNK